MSFDTHPRQIARYRDVKPAVTIASFKCRKCGEVRFSFAGRRKMLYGGWKCAECNTVSVPKTEKENASVTGL